MWIFGYGSLMWRPDFEWAARSVGKVEGWSRRFYQGSTDHRGVPGAPGRVVTLLEDAGEDVWGVAYKVSPSAGREIMERLDVREQGGYERVDLTVKLKNCSCAVEAVTYVATPQNVEYLGAAQMCEMANQVVRSSGPSGQNLEYLQRLAHTLRQMGVHDGHVFDLERHALQMQQSYSLCG